jgi:hypothetical protein
MREVTLSEVEEMVKEMSQGKAPGPDGFTIDFFQTCWSIIGKYLWEAVEEARYLSSILQAFNATFIALIPKEKESNTADKYRLISLCNVVYKIITKIIAKSLKPILQEIISPEQGGFVEGRQILDGIVVAHETIHSLQSSKKPGMLLKLDLSKAYDRINWNFLKAMLGAFGFDPSWINWIISLSSMTLFSILVNDSPSPTFNASWGLRQGDPLSPVPLYYSSGKPIGRFLQHSQREGLLKGLEISPRTEPLTHLQFVDDTLLLGKPTVQEARALKKALDIFLSTSGMQINLEKSHIFFFNTPTILQRKIFGILGFQRSSLPSRYLGVPVLEKASKNLGWQDLLTKLETRLNCWTHRFLTFPIRILLIKSVLMVMSVYLFSVLVAPKYIYQKTRALQRKFLWGGSKRERKWALVAWDKFCIPKSQGGLGLKYPQKLSQALATKIFWRWIKNPRILWAWVW